MLETNPLISPYDLPPFSAIRAEHLLPAIEKIITDSRLKVAGIITSQTTDPTWDDLVLGMDEVKARLDDTLQVIDIISPVMTQQAWANAAKHCTSLITAYKAQLARSNELFELYQKLANSQIAALFDEPRRRVLEKILREFRVSGIQLPQNEQQRLAGLNSDIHRQEREFKLRVQRAGRAWSKHIEKEALLAGLPDSVKRSMANQARAKNLQGWLFTLSEEPFRAVMRHAEHRPLRKEMWVAYYSRASGQGLIADPFNNDDVLKSLLEARHQKARLLGYENFAQLALEEQMAESSEQVLAFLRNVLAEQRSGFAREAQQLKELAAQQGVTPMEPWDYEYLAEKARQHTGFSQKELSAYFPLDTVLSRLCHFTQRLFGVELLERSNFDRWHEDVRLFEVREHDQTTGYLFIDPYRREGDDTTAEAFGLRNRRVTAEGRPRLPIAVLRGKLRPGTGNSPCLLDHEQLRTLLGEFGHCLQQLLTQVPYRDISGLNGLAHDTREFIGQVLEQWCSSKQFLIWMSSHFQTGETIPTDGLGQLMTDSQTQPSWATANELLTMLFDFEVHRTHGDGRSVQEVFDTLSAEVGHQQWPETVRPFNSRECMASRYAARGYSQKWSGVLATIVFERFISNGVFDPDTGRAFREAFLTHGDARPLVESLEVFLGTVYTGGLASPPDADEPLPADSTTTPSALLTNRLLASQQQMIRLNDALARPSEVARLHLHYWFRRTFPALAGNMMVEALSVRMLRNAPMPPSQRTTRADTTTLQALFWRAIAGKINTRELFRDLSSIVIVSHKDNVETAPAALNSQDAKNEIKWLLHTTSMQYEPMLVQALDNFWDRPAGFSQDRNVSDWLAHEFSTQLKTQADLHRLDTTLSPRLHKAVTDYALSAPDAASRVGLAEHVRPGVYGLSLTPQGWGFNVPLSGVVALTRHDNIHSPGDAVLYRPGHPLQIYDDLTALTAGLKEDGSAEDEVNTAPIAQNFLAGLVADLRTAQKTAVRNVLLNGSAGEEDITTWVARMDAAADVGERLDLAGVMDERELRLSREKLDQWLRGNPHVTRGDRLTWWNVVQDLHKAMADASPPPQDPVMLATPDALLEWTRLLLARQLEHKHLRADPDQVFLSIEREIIDPHAPTGSSPFDSGLSQGGVKGTAVYRQSMTQWAMSNLTPDERNVRNPLLEGPMSYEQFKDVIETADVGAKLPTALQITARKRQAEWMLLKDKQIRAQAWAAHISGDFRHDRLDTGLNLVLAALDSPEPQGRRKVNGHEVVVRQLRWGDSVLKELLAFGVRALASRPSLTLYTPGAPDGKTFRDVDAQSVRGLKPALVQALTATPQMIRWLISHLPLTEQAAQLDSLAPTPDDLTRDQKIKRVTQSFFAWAKDRARNDFALKIASPVVKDNLLQALHETQITHGISTAQSLTVSNAERDSGAAQEGRRRGVSLLTGALSIFPVGRLGGILGRAVLPVMAGGVAVSAIKDEGGSGSQWIGDFISGLGEVLAEAGQDLIMTRAGRHRSKQSPMLAGLPRMPDPELKPFRLKEFDSKGLVPEGRGLYRDAGGYQYLKLEKDYYKTTIQDGERIIYLPNDRASHRMMTWENGKWQLEERRRLLGGGSWLGRYSRALETPHKHALLEGVLRWSSANTTGKATDVINSMPNVLAERILRESMDDVGISDMNTYRSRIKTLYPPRNTSSNDQTPHQKLLHKYNVWEAVDACTKDIEANVDDIHLTPHQRINIFDKVMILKTELYDGAGNFKLNMASIVDNFTGAVFIATAPGQGRKHVALDKIQNDLIEMINIAENVVLDELEFLLPGQGRAAKEAYVKSPEHRDECKKKILAALRNEMERRRKPGLLTEIRNHKIPYIIVNKGKSQRNTILITEDAVKDFSKNLSNYNAPDIDVVTKLPSKKVTGAPPVATDPSAPPVTSTATDTFTVSTTPLAEMQMSYDNFPEVARTKITEIMADIRAGRTTTKRINKYYWYDMAQLTPGSGRGAWRAAFERRGDTWALQGFYDYHTQGTIVWGG